MAQVISIHPASSEYSLVIAIDFGTTRSGFIHSFLDDGANEISSSNIHGFDNWSIIHDMNLTPYAKTRTESLYENRKLIDWGWGARKESYFIKSNTNLLKLFKLKLQEESELFTDENTIFNIVDVVADYLQKMKTAALDLIHDDLNFRISNNRILWCITVPAIWTDLAVDRMKRAAIKAGIINENEKDIRLLFVREPEAAAVHCFFNLLNRTLSIGETFMVIDAGGGTIDLTSYRVSYNLKLEEIAKSSGGNHGSSFVDQNFMLYLAYLGLDVEKVGRDNKLLALQIAWEAVKHAISSNQLSYSVPIEKWKYFKEKHENFLKKLSNDQDGEDTEIILSPALIQELFNPSETSIYQKFNPVFKGVKEDIQNHINSLKDKGYSTVNNVFLVGGFNRSPLLNQFIIDNFKFIVDDNVKRFIKPLRPEQAIMEGACIYAINPSIIHSRISKLTYGLSGLREYDPSIHAGRPHKIFDGVDYCLDIFLRMCAKNESIDYNQCIKMTYRPAERNQQNMDVKVFCSDDENPHYTTDKSVKKLASIEVPLPGYGLDRKIEVRFYFGKADIQIEAENLQSNEIKKIAIKFSSSFG